MGLVYNKINRNARENFEKLGKFTDDGGGNREQTINNEKTVLQERGRCPILIKENVRKL